MVLIKKQVFESHFAKKRGSYKKNSQNGHLANFMPFLDPKLQNVYFWPHHQIPREILSSFDVSHIGYPKLSFGAIWDLFGSTFRNHPDKNLRMKKNVLNLENCIWNLQKELTGFIRKCVV